MGDQGLSHCEVSFACHFAAVSHYLQLRAVAATASCLRQGRFTVYGRHQLGNRNAVVNPVGFPVNPVLLLYAAAEATNQQRRRSRAADLADSPYMYGESARLVPSIVQAVHWLQAMAGVERKRKNYAQRRGLRKGMGSGESLPPLPTDGRSGKKERKNYAQRRGLRKGMGSGLSLPPLPTHGRGGTSQTRGRCKRGRSSTTARASSSTTLTGKGYLQVKHLQVTSRLNSKG